MEGSVTSFILLYQFGSLLKYVEDFFIYCTLNLYTHTKQFPCHWTSKILDSCAAQHSFCESFIKVYEVKEMLLHVKIKETAVQTLCLVLWVHLGSNLISLSYTAFLWHYWWWFCLAFLCSWLFYFSLVIYSESTA